MFTPTTRTFFCLTGILLIINSTGLYSQNAGLNRQQLEQETMASFQEGDYRSALSGFRKLIEVEPTDPMHPYHAGICKVELNEDLEDAIEFLFGASTRGVPADVNYYLGMAYHRNYNFIDAEKYFGRFEIAASRQEVKDYHISHLLETTRSAADITTSYNPLELLNVTFIDLSDSAQFSQVKMKGGQLQRKPAAYFSVDEDPYGLTSIAFVPRNPVRGDFIYYSGYGRNKKDGFQLFRIKKGTGNSWGDPQEIKPLNSQGDEILPYFDPIESDLYFATNGRLGVGGFDLYRTHFDSERDQWSEPVNLGFPVNSAMDEYLLLPGTDLGMVMFFSNRQGTDSTLTVYRVHLVEPKKNTVANDNKILKEIANLGGAADEILAELEKMNEPIEPPQQTLVDDQERAAPSITTVTVLSESKIQSRYRNILSQALLHQAASDSLSNLASNARFLVEDSDDPNDRWVWQKQIMLWEKKARDEEKIADDLYAKLEAERTANNARISSAIPDAIEVDTVMGDLTVYRYTQSGPTASTSASAKPIPDGFEMLDHSPYSLHNPIPMDVPLPPGVFYRIQLGSFTEKVEPEAFKGISPITGIHAEGQGRVKYFAGKFTKYEDASTALSMMQAQGYEDAFIVAWYNGNIVSTQKAKQLE